MRYRLRTLLIVVALAPPVMAGILRQAPELMLGPKATKLAPLRRSTNGTRQANPNLKTIPPMFKG